MATFQDIRGKAVRALIRKADYPSQSKSFKYAEHGGKAKARKAAKAWAVQKEAELAKLDPATLRKAGEHCFHDVIDVYCQTRIGFRLGDESPREALKTFKRDGSNACQPLGNRKPITGNNIDKALSPLFWWNDCLGTRPLSKITRQDILKTWDTLNDGKRTPAALNNYLAAVRAAFQLVTYGGGRHDWLESNPAVIKKIHTDNRREVVLTDDQAKRLLSACTKSECEDLLLIVLIGIATGARQGNIMDLRWDGLDLKTGRVDIPGDRMKNGEDWATIITGEALELLQHRKKQLDKQKVRYVGTAPYVFPSKRIDGPCEFPRKFWDRALDSAGIKRRIDKRSRKTTGFRFHDLRHTFATRMAILGASVQQLKIMTGHKTTQQLDRYVNIDLSSVEDFYSAQHTKRSKK